MLADNVIKNAYLIGTLESMGDKLVRDMKTHVNEKIKAKGNYQAFIINAIHKRVDVTGLLSANLVIDVEVAQRIRDIKLKGGIYNKVVYWYYYHVASVLQNGMTEAVINKIRMM